MVLSAPTSIDAAWSEEAIRAQLRLNLGKGFGGKRVFVDNRTGAGGSDSNSGLDPENPLLTIAAGLAEMRSRYNDYLFIRGTFSEQVVIDEHEVHLIGMGQGFEHGRQCMGTKLNGVAAGPTVEIQAEDCEIAGLYVFGNRDASENHDAILVNGNEGGKRAWIHHNTVMGLTQGATTYQYWGIGLLGQERSLVEHNLVRNSLRGIGVTYQNADIVSATYSSYQNVIRNNTIQSCNYGIVLEHSNVSTSQGDHMVIDNIINSNQAESADYGIYVGAGAPLLVGNMISGYTDPISPGSATMIRNFGSADGGAAIIIT